MKYLNAIMGAAAMAGAGFAASSATMGLDPYLGEIQQFGGNYCPRGYAPTNGQLLSISQNSALFSLLGTTYGGDGRTTFALPDLRGRAMVGVGRGNGLANDYRWGEKFGVETTTLTTNNLPSHSHSATLRAQNAAGVSDNPANGLLADFPDGQPIYAAGRADTNMNSGAIQVGNTGANQPFNNLQPSIAVTTCIAITGVYPSRP